MRPLASFPDAIRLPIFLMQMLISLQANGQSQVPAQKDHQCPRLESPTSPKIFFNTIYGSSCEITRNSEMCQKIYKQIEGSGESAEDYKLRCDEFGSRNQDLSQFYLGCYIGMFDATIGDFGKFLGETSAKIVMDFETEKYCNANLEYKRMLYFSHNLSNPEPELQIAIPSKEKLNEYDCGTLRRAIFEEHRYLVVKKNRRNSDSKKASSTQEPQRLLSQSDGNKALLLAKDLLQQLNVRLDCYNSQKQAELLCAAATYIGGAASLSKVALKKIKSLAGLKEASKNIGVLSRAYSPEELAMLESLVNRGLISKVDMQVIIETGNTDKIYLLYSQNKILESELDKIVEPFRALDLGEFTGSGFVLEFTPKGFSKSTKSKVIVQSYNSDLKSGQGVALIDPVTKKTIATLDYTVGGNTLVVDFLRVSRTNQNFGYSEIIFEQVLKLHPEVKVIKSQMGGTNETLLLELLKKGVPLEQAVKETPSYKIHARLGFTDFQVTVIQRNAQNGTPIKIFNVTATKLE